MASRGSAAYHSHARVRGAPGMYQAMTLVVGVARTQVLCDMNEHGQVDG